MRGHVTQRRPGVWLVRLDGGKDPVSGKRRQPSRTVKGNRDAADLALAQLMVDLGRGMLPTTGATVAQLFERWFAHAASRLSPTTLRGYQKLARQRILPRFGDQALDKVSTAELDLFYDGLVAEGLSARTVRNVHSVIRRAYAHAIRWGWVSVNPATNTSPPPAFQFRREPLAIDDVARAVKTITETDPEFAVFVRLAIGTGARRGELCALRWSDVDWEHRSISIARSIAGVEGGWVEKATKTNRERTVMLDWGTLEVLRAHRRKMEERAVLDFTVLGPDAFVFSFRLDGTEPWHPDTATHHWMVLRRDAGLPSWARLHDVRHAHASALIDKGVPIATVSERLGHASQSITLDVYSHAYKARDAEAAQVIGDALSDGG